MIILSGPQFFKQEGLACTQDYAIIENISSQNDLCYNIIVAGNAWSIVIHIYAVGVCQTGMYEPL